MNVVDLKDDVDRGGDLSSCHHREILGLHFFGQLNLFLELRVQELHDAFRE